MAPRGKAKEQEPEGPKRWQFQWGDRLLREDDITLSEAMRIETRTGESWLTMSPLRSAKHAYSIIVVMVATATGRSEEEIEAEVGGSTAEDLFRTFKTVDPDTPSVMEDGNPPPAAAPSTGSSPSTANRRSAGRRQ